jgi:flagellar basal-body rod protein FlgF
MTTGQYAAISTMAAMQAAHTAISNNLANIGTPGYKQDIPQTEQFNNIFVTLLDVHLGLGNVDTTTEIVGETGGGTQLLPLLLDLTQGSLRATGRPLDLGLAAAGFLTVDTGGGSLAYMRGGSLRRSDDGTITDQSGNRVLDIAGNPITLPSGDVVFNSDGTITGADGDLGQLAIVDLADGQTWTKVGGNLFLPADPLTPPTQVADPQVRQGFLEFSNVNAVDQFAEMLSTMRVFQAAGTMLELLDSTQEATAQTVGSV